MRKELIFIAIIALFSLFLTSCYKTDYIFDIQSCEVDDDCVREASCCDCSEGKFINRKYFEDVKCEEQCDCEPVITIGVCIENNCEPVRFENEFCDDEENHRIGETWNDSSKRTCTCNQNREITCNDDDTQRQASQDLNNYYSSIDYSCNTDSECTVKDIHNCCGEYPECVNVDAEVNSEKVTELCEKSDTAAVCGFPTINGCECKDNKCSGVV